MNLNLFLRIMLFILWKKKSTQLHYKSVNAKNPKKQKKTKKQLKKQEDIAFDFFYIL